MIIEPGIKLAPHTTLRVGGAAKYFTAVSSIKELEEACIFSKEYHLAVFILGEGSNVLVSDNGFNGLVIKIEMKGTAFTDIGDSVEVVASAGENWDEFVKETVSRGLYGIENLSYIPGTVGATPIQNVGAYGVEVKDVIKWVEVFQHESLTFQILGNKDCQFAYRDSIFKKKEGEKFIVTRVCYRLGKEGMVNTSYADVKRYFAENTTHSPTLEDMRNAIISIRSRKFPNVREAGTAGSFFKNPIISMSEYVKLRNQFPDLPKYDIGNGYVKVPLAWILDRCGWKRYRKGDVGVFENQPLVLVNFGGGSAKELEELAEEIRRDIQEKTGIDIENEITYIGN